MPTSAVIEPVAGQNTATSHERLLAYLRGPFQHIGGWCSPWLWQFIYPLAERQSAMRVSNPVAEIGVYQGKFFLGLMLTKMAPAHNYAIDVFDLQRFNLDGAGAGDLDRFQRNIDAVGISRASIEVLRADSMSLTSLDIQRIRGESNGFAMFSVDGCHKVEHTVNDIGIAMQLTVPEGIIFVDDYTNSDWPGVQEGVAKLYLMHSPKFVPLAVLHNKLFLCHLSYHSEFLQHLIDVSKRLSGARAKVVTRFGYSSINLFPAQSGEEFLGNERLA